jgi:hypothetical protein
MTYYDLNKYISILSNDIVLKNLLVEFGYLYSSSNTEYTNDVITSYNNKIYYNLANFYFSNSSAIQNNSVSYLTDLSITANFIMASQIYSILKTETSPTVILSQIYYTLKYSTVNMFFRDNYQKFLPDYDASFFVKGSKLGVYQNALMEEFDKFSSIISDIGRIGDIDTIPEAYLSYIAQLVGYENTGLQILSDEAFRYLIKNIIDIYNIKGTTYSFELFFNFLGFNTVITEYWFDRRLYFSGNKSNPFTGETDPTKFGFYLTATDPRTIKYSFSSEITNKADGILTLADFDSLADTTQSVHYSVPELLGYKTTFGPSGYKGKNFTYFKTNIVGYNIISIDTNYISTSVNSTDMVNTLKTYIEDLTPVNIYKIITFSSAPFQDDGSASDETGASTIMVEELPNDLIERSFYDVNQVGTGDVNGIYYTMHKGEFFPSPQILPIKYVYDYINHPERKSNPAGISGSLYTTAENNESQIVMRFATNPGPSGIENGTDSYYTQQTISASDNDYTNNMTHTTDFINLKYRNLGNLNILDTNNFYMKDSWPKVSVLEIIFSDLAGNSIIKINNPFNGDNMIKLNRNSLGQFANNTIELRYLVNRKQDGIYSIITAYFDNPSNPKYLYIQIPSVRFGTDQSGIGGVAYINRESSMLSSIASMPFYSDKAFTETLL